MVKAIIKFADRLEEFHAIRDMLYDYVRELHALEPEHVILRTKQQLVQEWFFDETIVFMLVLSDDKPAGFAVIDPFGHRHPHADISIEEFYIMPQFRRQGIGSALACRLIAEADIVHLDIIRSNHGANAFWSKIFESWADVTENYPEGPAPKDWVASYSYKNPV